MHVCKHAIAFIAILLLPLCIALQQCCCPDCGKGYHGTRRKTGGAMDQLKNHIRNIPDFPRPGIQFKDITPLVKDPTMLRLAVQQLIQPFRAERLTAVVGMEARGFIFGSLAAWELDVGFVPLRKPGKLPYDVQQISYDLEYGTAALEVHIDALESGDRVLLVDDLIATGGTAAASCELIEKLGAEVAGCAFVVELDALRGRRKLAKYRVHSLVHY
jgi:adenine phosphoribosyltransferase